MSTLDQSHCHSKCVIILTKQENKYTSVHVVQHGLKGKTVRLPITPYQYSVVVIKQNDAQAGTDKLAVQKSLSKKNVTYGSNVEAQSDQNKIPTYLSTYTMVFVFCCKRS